MGKNKHKNYENVEPETPIEEPIKEMEQPQTMQFVKKLLDPNLDETPDMVDLFGSKKTKERKEHPFKVTISAEKENLKRFWVAYKTKNGINSEVEGLAFLIRKVKEAYPELLPTRQEMAEVSL